MSAKGRGQKEREGLAEALAPPPPSEFSRLFNLAQLRTGRTIKLSPVVAEMAGLCRRFGVDELVDMRVEVHTMDVGNGELAAVRDCVKGIAAIRLE